MGCGVDMSARASIALSSDKLEQEKHAVFQDIVKYGGLFVA